MPRPNRRRMLLGCAIAVAAIFVVDCVLPLGVAVGVSYVAVILLAVGWSGRRTILGFAVTCTLLTLLGAYLSPMGGEAWKVLANRMLSLFVIWTTTLLLLRQRQTENGLDESEVRARSILNSAADGIIAIDERGIIKTFNAAAQRMFGYDSNEVVGHNITMLMPDPYQQEHDGHLQAYSRTGIRKVIGKRREVLGKRRDGSTFSMELHISEVRLGDRRVFTGIATDITERKRAEVEAKRFRVALETSPDAIFVIDRATMRFVDVNDTACTSLGYTRDELLAMGPQDIKPDFIKDTLAAKFDAIIPDENAFGVLETTHGRKDGSTFPVEVSLRGSTIEGETVVAAVVRDVTERMRANLEMRRLAAFPQDNHNPLFELSESGVVRYCNRAAKAMTASLNLPLDEPFALLPHDVASIAERCLRDGEHVFDREHQVAGRTLVWAFHPVPGRDLIHAYGQDITERIRGEQELKAYATAVEATNEALREANATAENTAKTKSEFLANMSHEIRTPMTAILGFAETLLDPALAEPERFSAVQTIRRNGQHLLEIINDILDISKIEAGKMTVETIPCSTCQIIEDVTSLMLVRSQAKGLALNAEYIGEVPDTIRTDPTRLRQILINLLGNAIKFTDSGGVRLVVRLVDKDGDEPMLQFDVIDTGIGMTREQASRLFKAFTQADASLTREFGGTGLGLCLSERFSIMLGGDIEIVETEPGMGTRFRATIAIGSLDGVAMIEPGRTGPPKQRVMPPATGTAKETRLDCRILLAEDGLDNQRLLTLILKKAGAEVTVVENGQLAVEAAVSAWEQGSPFEMILMDMQMPVMDGYDATRLLRTKGYAGPVIALTAHAMTGDREKCLAAGCDEYATKPVKRAELIKQIQQFLTVSPATT